MIMTVLIALKRDINCIRLFYYRYWSLNTKGPGHFILDCIIIIGKQRISGESSGQSTSKLTLFEWDELMFGNCSRFVILNDN